MKEIYIVLTAIPPHLALAQAYESHHAWAGRETTKIRPPIWIRDEGYDPGQWIAEFKDGHWEAKQTQTGAPVLLRDPSFWNLLAKLCLEGHIKGSGNEESREAVAKTVARSATWGHARFAT